MKNGPGLDMMRIMMHKPLFSFLFSIYLATALCASTWSQILPGAAPEQAASAPKDPLGRSTPRTSVMGFLAAARKADYSVAVGYLNTPLRGKAADDLAMKLSVVLDRRLPAKLNELSDKPEGSLKDALHSDREVVGTVSSEEGKVDIVLERVDRGKSGPLWLFSRQTLEAIPDVYDEIAVVDVDTLLPSFLVSRRIIGIPLFEWCLVLFGLPLIYLVASLLSRLISPLAGRLRRQVEKRTDLPDPEILPHPIRLLAVAIAIRWLLSKVQLSLLARQFWSSVSIVIVIAAVVWILILIGGVVERYATRRMARRKMVGTSSVLRLARRVFNALLVFAGGIAVLYNFGFNPTAALAGLGVGGIAVALAAQKTLENVIGGISLIFDQVIRVGDTVKAGNFIGTVEEVGLRSTRIRTNDRTLVSIPNGQVATMSIETLSARDKFWFRHLIGLRYETTPALLMRSLVDLRNILRENIAVEPDSVRVRFLAFGASSLDVELFAYLYARDWNNFLELQEGLLLSIMEHFEKAGVQIAFPSRTIYLEPGSSEGAVRIGGFDAGPRAGNEPGDSGSRS